MTDQWSDGSVVSSPRMKSPFIWIVLSSIAPLMGREHFFNPFSAGTAFMHMQTGWIQANRRVTRRLAWDPTCLPLSLSLAIKNKQNLQVLKSRRQYNLFLENYPAFKDSQTDLEYSRLVPGNLVHGSAENSCMVQTKGGNSTHNRLPEIIEKNFLSTR